MSPMMVESFDDRMRKEYRCQYSIRSLLITMLVLGPLVGWYGVSLVIQIRDYFVPDAPAEQSDQISEDQVRLQREMAQYHIDRKRLQVERETRDAEQLELLGPMYDAPTDRNGS